jgi:2-octaprenyl-6-methoxyphenol hydroxylase
MKHYDIAIVGGGLVGASLAVALHGSGHRTVLIEAAVAPRSEPSWDERCIALNDASRRIFEALGVWPLLIPEAEPIRATHISERGRFGVARFSAADAGLDALGYNLPLRAIGAALWARMQDCGIERVCPGRVEAIALAGDRVRLDVVRDAAAPAEPVSARLLAAADGARSAVRERLGIAAQVRDYAQHAIVSAVRLSRPHQGVAYERFTPDGPLALIPKPGDAASLVWSVPSVRVDTMLAWSDEEYLARAQETFGGRLGRFLELGRRTAFPLARVLSAQLTAPRTVLLGNAAQSLHPVAAQGFNLGLRDVAALAELLREARDPGAAELLDAFAARRTHDRERVAGVTDLMVRSFSNRVPGLAQTRHWGLVAVDLAPGLREAVLRQHLGHLGLPRAS